QHPWSTLVPYTTVFRPRTARELAAAGRAAVYGRIGTCTQAYGTLNSWLVDALNVLTGNLDRPGGAMFPRPAHAPVYRRRKPFTRSEEHTSELQSREKLV